MGTVWALCGHCVGTVLPRLMRKLLLRVRASPALDGRQRQPGRRTRKKGEGPLNKRMRNDNLLHDTLSTCAAHNPTDGHVSDLPPMAASRATTKKQTDLATKRGAAAHSKSPFRCERNKRPFPDRMQSGNLLQPPLQPPISMLLGSGWPDCRRQH